MNPYENYKRQMVNTMTQPDLLNMLFDGMVKQIEIAKIKIDCKAYPEMDTALVKARNIVKYLKGALDFRYPIAHSLANMYNFFEVQLNLAGIKKSVDILNEIEPLVQELKDTFAECEKINRSSKAAAMGANTSLIGSNV